MRNLFIIIMLLITRNLFGQPINGSYEGALARDGSIQLVKFEFMGSSARYHIPELGLYDVVCEKLSWVGDTLNVSFYYGNFYCFVDKASGDITGISQRWDPKLRLHLKKSKTETKKFTEEKVSFNNGAIKLEGSIYKPIGVTKPVPYVVLVHGSGYHDRETPYYRSLAYALATNGIGVLLYDKRGCGKSTGKFEEATFYELAADANAALNQLYSRKGLMISKAGFLGTSQGGWIAPIAANTSKHCSFIILNVGPSVSVFEQDIHRVKYSLASDYESQQVDSAVAYTKLYFDYVQHKRSQDFEKLKDFSKQIKDKEWAEDLNLLTGNEEEDFGWWRKNDYNPSEQLKKVKVPVLSLFGEKDVLVPPDENKNKMDSLLKLSKTKYKIVEISGAAHDMLTFQGLNGPNWKWPIVYWQWRKQPNEFMDEIIKWVIQPGKP